MSVKTLLTFVAATLLVACLQAADDSRLEESRALVQAFGTTLQAELKSGLAEGGPVGAISVCKDKAPRIASNLSRQSGAMR